MDLFRGYLGFIQLLFRVNSGVIQALIRGYIDGNLGVNLDVVWCKLAVIQG